MMLKSGEHIYIADYMPTDGLYIGSDDGVLQEALMAWCFTGENIIGNYLPV